MFKTDILAPKILIQKKRLMTGAFFLVSNIQLIHAKFSLGETSKSNSSFHAFAVKKLESLPYLGHF